MNGGLILVMNWRRDLMGVRELGRGMGWDCLVNFEADSHAIYFIAVYTLFYWATGLKCAENGNYSAGIRVYKCL